MSRAEPRERGRRGGYTLVELLVGAVVGGLVSAAAVATAARVRAAAGREADRAAGRAQLAAAASVVAAELAAAAGTAGPEGSDVAELSDTAADVRAVVGGGVACAVTAGAGGPVVDVAAGDAAVGWWAVTPRAGDVLLAHDPGATAGPSDDAWTARTVRAATGVLTACASGPFAAAATAGGAVPWRLALDGAALPATVAAGAPVRVVRRRRYTLYRGGDNLWVLGMREWDASGWQTVQPLAGPFDAPGAGGMRVLVRDSAGATWTGAAVGTVPPGAEVEVAFAASGYRGGLAWRDSAHAVVRLRGDEGRP